MSHTYSNYKSLLSCLPQAQAYAGSDHAPHLVVALIQGEVYNILCAIHRRAEHAGDAQIFVHLLDALLALLQQPFQDLQRTIASIQLVQH